jgi:Glycosyltransferase family 87
VTPAIRRSLPFLLVALASAWLTLTPLLNGDYPANFGPGDYWFDGGPAITALAHGHLSAFLDAHPVMGPLSIILRAPFAALAGAGQLAEYRWGSFPCVLAVGLLGLYLAGIARRRGASTFAQAILVGLCIFNPLTFSALESGHPEDLLTTALAVAAVVVASEGRLRWAALLLGLAVATKQWAVIATLPVLMALPGAAPSTRIKVGLGAAAIALLVYLPGLLADPGAFFSSQSNAASTHAWVASWSVWYPFAGSVPGVVGFGPGAPGVPHSGGSELIGALAHPLIVGLAVVLPAALALRRRRFELGAADALGLLVLLALLRCALDPVNVTYYQLPVVLGVVALDALSTRGLPLRGVLAAAISLALWRLWNSVDPHLFNAVYLAVVVPAILALAAALFGVPARSRRPKRASAAPLRRRRVVAPSSR